MKIGNHAESLAVYWEQVEAWNVFLQNCNQINAGKWSIVEVMKRETNQYVIGYNHDPLCDEFIWET